MPFFQTFYALLVANEKPQHWNFLVIAQLGGRLLDFRLSHNYQQGRAAMWIWLFFTLVLFSQWDSRFSKNRIRKETMFLYIYITA